MRNIKKLFFAICGLALTSQVYAHANTPFYVAGSLSIFQAEFNNRYIDLTDPIPQNIVETVPQNGYSATMAAGYQRWLCEKYSLGGEISASFDNQTANFQSGAASTAFADSVQINKHFDLVLVPGLMLTDSITAYLKLGVSVASLRDNLASPAGYTPVNGNFNSSKTKAGFAGGIGVKKAVTDHLDVFAEGNYHDYGSVTFANFQNFTANYSHTAHVYSSAVTAGLAYNF